MKAGQRGSSGWQFAAVSVEQPNAERLGEAGPAVVRGAATHADDDTPEAGIQCSKQKFARTHSRGPRWVAFLLVQQHEA